MVDLPDDFVLAQAEPRWVVECVNGESGARVIEIGGLVTAGGPEDLEIDPPLSLAPQMHEPSNHDATMLKQRRRRGWSSAPLEQEKTDGSDPSPSPAAYNG